MSSISHRRKFATMFCGSAEKDCASLRIYPDVVRIRLKIMLHTKKDMHIMHVLLFRA